MLLILKFWSLSTPQAGGWTVPLPILHREAFVPVSVWCGWWMVVLGVTACDCGLANGCGWRLVAIGLMA